MKKISILLLTVLLFTALAPTVVLTFSVAREGAPVLGMLDVCRQASPAVSSSGLMPYIHQCPCVPIPSLFVTYLESSTHMFPQFLLSHQYDRPPQA